MSKKIIIILVILAILVGGYWWMHRESPVNVTPSAEQSTLLTRVPADTTWFAGGLEQMPFINPYDKDSVEIMKASLKDQLDQFSKVSEGFKSPALSMLIALYIQAMDDMYSNTGSKINPFAIYSLGIYPVAAWQPAKTGDFIAQLDAIEKEKNISSRKFSLGKANLREYAFSEGTPVKLYITVNDNIISLGITSSNEKILNLLAGTDFPRHSLADSGKLQSIRAEHKLLPYALFYFDANLAMKNLSSADENLLKQTLQEVGSEHTVAEIVKNICFTDMSTIISRWPKMVMGYRKFDYQSNPMDMEAAIILEHTDQQFLSSLKTITGTIPDYSFKQDIVSLALGLNIDNLAPFLTDLREDIVSKTYRCPALVNMQKSIKQFNPGMVAMSTQMLAGVKGIGVNLTKLDAAASSKGDLSMNEGVVTIISSNPKNLLLAASNFYPPLAKMNLKPDGVSQPLALPNGLAGSVSMSNNALALMLGDSEENKARIAGIFKGKGLSSALLGMGMDLSTYFKILIPMIDKMSPLSTHQNPEQLQHMKQMLGIFEKLQMKFDYKLVIESKGIVLDLKMKMLNPKKH